MHDKVEVVYIPEGGKENGQGHMQCRVIKPVPCGTLRIYPYGGRVVHLDDSVSRTHVEQRFEVKPCYMKGVQVSAKAKNSSAIKTHDFIVYSAMSHKQSPLVSVALGETLSCTRHFSPFWAVMLVGRDTKEMVNMAPYMEEYVIPHAVAKNHGALTLGSKLSVELPFLSNKRDLAVGDLLALPFDGGLSSICCEKCPSIVQKKS